MVNAAPDPELALLVGRTSSLANDAHMLPNADVVARATALEAALSGASEIISSKESKDGIKSWKAWLQDKADKGWRRAHAYSRLPDAWKSQEVTNCKGQLSGDPIDIRDRT